MTRKQAGMMLIAIAAVAILSAAAAAFLRYGRDAMPAKEIEITPNITEEYKSRLLKELEDAEKELVKMPDNIDNYIVAARLKQKLGKLSAAEKTYKEALQKDPNDYVIYTDLGILYDEMERFEEADNMLRAATSIQPKDARAFLALIDLYKMHFPGSADELDNIYRAAGDYTESAEVWASYAKFLEDRRDYRQAFIYWDAIAKAEPENVDAKANADRLKSQLGL